MSKKIFKHTLELSTLLLFICTVIMLIQPVKADSISNNAQKISVNSTYSGKCANNYTGNWYQFSTPNDGYVILTFTHDLYDGTYAGWDNWRAYLYNYNGELLMWTGSPGNRRLTNSVSLGIPAGTYYIKIVSYHSNPEGIHANDGIYNFKVNYSMSTNWEKETNNEFNTANPISLNSTIYGCIASSGDLDYYTFNIPNTALVNIQFNHPFEEDYGSWAHWVMTIYNYNGDIMFSGGFKGTQISTTTEILSLSPGTYYVKIQSEHDNVAGWHGSNATYNYKIVPHIHSYKNVVTKATPSSNGKITQTCSCGATGNVTTIYSQHNISLSAAKYTYNGKRKKPTVTVKDSNGSTINSSNYTVKYSNGCKNIGTYTILVLFKGNYDGMLSTQFKIVPKNTKITKTIGTRKGITVRWKKLSSRLTSGYQIQYSTNKSFRNAKIITKKGYGNSSLTIKRLKAKRKYYIRIRTYKTVSGKNLYSAWSAAKYARTK